MRELPSNTLWEMPSQCLSFLPLCYTWCYLHKWSACLGSHWSLLYHILACSLRTYFKQAESSPFLYFPFISLLSGLRLMYSGCSCCLPSLSTLHSGKLCLVSTWLPRKTPLGKNQVLLTASGLNSCSPQAETGQRAFRPHSRVAHTVDLSRLWHEVILAKSQFCGMV